ncbi:hypothetical protein CN454_29120 [Bacillus cereus]|jgi:hypothetical protein|uniref:hypothetical protein n=1 Tax=Bacillus TaxID=1386 RepID=UPI000BEDFCBD|nr:MULTISPECIES: hypothetical protein [Bacillus cereus group]MBG9520250.1 hypothetical protein [Bacillus thuringiensis]PDZ36476.1 hypothetical protein CON18_30605 [Bacillus cereus]PEX05824.1 hypothetical protein CN454_29120 [Bacillus cereus]PFS79582.1 hypothetical protein COK49_13720 [Bacillus cereus]PGS07945.1 hypothetical protein COC51_26970 [Bacillus cereus]
MFKGLGAVFTLAILGILILSFGTWSAIWLGLAWIISYVFNLDVSYMTVFTISSIVWLLVVIVKSLFAYLGKKAAERFWD